MTTVTPASSSRSSASVTTQATSTRASEPRSSPVISQSIQTMRSPALPLGVLGAGRQGCVMPRHPRRSSGDAYHPIGPDGPVAPDGRRHSHEVARRGRTSRGVRAPLGGSPGIAGGGRRPLLAGVGGRGGGPRRRPPRRPPGGRHAVATVTGTVERIHLDDFAHPLPRATRRLTFVRTADGSLQVPADDLAQRRRRRHRAPRPRRHPRCRGSEPARAGRRADDLPAAPRPRPRGRAHVASVEVVADRASRRRLHRYRRWPCTDAAARGRAPRRTGPRRRRPPAGRCHAPRHRGRRSPPTINGGVERATGRP